MKEDNPDKKMSRIKITILCFIAVISKHLLTLDSFHDDQVRQGAWRFGDLPASTRSHGQVLQ